MAEKLFLELISPEKALVSMEVDSIVATGECGEFGLLPGHAAFLTSLKIGGFSYTVAGNTTHVAVAKGFLKVSDDKVVVLAERAEFGKDVDINQAKEQKAEAERVLEESKDKGDETFAAALKAIEYQETRIEAFERSK